MHLDFPLQPQGVLGYVQRRPRSRLRMLAVAVAVIAFIALIGFGVTFVIPQGSKDAVAVSVMVTGSKHDIIRVLGDVGVLRYPRAFRVALELRGSNVAVGQYTLSPHLSVWSLARVLTTTQPRPEKTLTIIEGWNLRDIGQYLEREGIAQAEELHELVGFPAMDYRNADPVIPRPRDFSTDFTFLKDGSKPVFVGLEGYLFPDTYRVYADATLEDIVRKILTNFDRKITSELHAEIAMSGRSLHQILTMASLVEAEVATDADRAIVAGILWKRRDRGWLLQADSTVNYVTGKQDARTKRADHTVDSSYNTYKYAGLPHGPINNPGVEAILAALRPQPSPHWFFLTTPDGTVIYARTLDEHNANVARFLQ